MPAPEHPDFETVRDIGLALRRLADEAADAADGCQDMMMQEAIGNISGALFVLALGLGSLLDTKRVPVPDRP